MSAKVCSHSLIDKICAPLLQAAFRAAPGPSKKCRFASKPAGHTMALKFGPLWSTLLSDLAQLFPVSLVLGFLENLHPLYGLGYWAVDWYSSWSRLAMWLTGWQSRVEMLSRQKHVEMPQRHTKTRLGTCLHKPFLMGAWLYAVLKLFFFSELSPSILIP
jgi:hypothetical protein